MSQLIKRAEIYQQLEKLHNEAVKSNSGMTPEKNKVFTQLLNDFEYLTNEIRFKDLTDQVEKTVDPDLNLNLSVLNRNAAKRTLFDAFGMLARGERKAVNSTVLSDLATKYGLVEERIGNSSSDIVQTNLTNVFLEVCKDDRFLSRIPTETVRDGYLKVPIVTRENYPVSYGKAYDVAATGTDTIFTSATFEPKNQYVLNRFHKDLIRDGGQRAMDSIWQSSRDAISKKLVQGILYGDSSNAGEFNGLDNISGKIVYDTSGGTIVDYSLVTRGAKELNNKFVDHNEMLGIISPVTYQMYSNLREESTSGSYLMPPPQIAPITILSNAQVKTDYSSNKTRLYMFRPQSSLLALFGNFELELNERYADFDQAAAMIVLRTDFKFLDPEHLFIATNLPTT
jgi:hypothetical protein